MLEIMPVIIPVEYQIGIGQKIPPVWVIWMWAHALLYFIMFIVIPGICVKITLTGL